MKKDNYSHSTDFDSCNVFHLAEFIAKRIIPEHSNGFTINALTKMSPFPKNAAPQDIYYVSLKGCERQFQGVPAFTELVRWISDHYILLYRPGHYVGGWQNFDTFYLDVTIAVKGKTLALEVAAENKQVAIFQPATNKTILVPNILQKPA